MVGGEGEEYKAKKHVRGEVDGGRYCEGEIALKKCSLWLRMATATFGDIRARAGGSLVGEKEINMEMEPIGMRIDLAAMRVKASESFLQSLVHVCAACEVLRSSGKFRALEMRSSMSASPSRVWVAWAYSVANMARDKRAREEATFLPRRAEVVNPESLSCMSIEMWTGLVSHSV